MSDTLDTYKLNLDHKPFGVVSRSALGQPGSVGVATPVALPGLVELGKLQLAGIADNMLCFRLERETDAVDSSAEAAENIRKLYDASHYSYQYYRSLDQITGSTPWPEFATSQPFKVEVGQPERVAGECWQRHGEEHCAMDHRVVPVMLCGAAPQVPADAGFFALAVVYPADDAYRNLFALWKLGE
jgi:hypothetical protein